MNQPFLRLIAQFTNALANLVIFALVVRWGIIAVALGYVIRGYFVISTSSILG